jgi:hypothetical protein
MAEPVTIGSLIALAISNVGWWIREWKRGRKNENGELLKCIDGKVGAIKTDVAVIKTNQANQEKHCKETTERFGREIVNNRTNIIDLLKGKG